MRAYITIGATASGKTTWATEFAKECNAVIISRDNARKAILAADYNSQRNLLEQWPPAGMTLDAAEELTTKNTKAEIERCAKEQRDIIIDDNNTNIEYLVRLEAYLSLLGYSDIRFFVFIRPISELIARNKTRLDMVDEDIIRSDVSDLNLILQTNYLSSKRVAFTCIPNHPDTTPAQNAHKRVFYHYAVDKLQLANPKANWRFRWKGDKAWLTVTDERQITDFDERKEYMQIEPSRLWNTEE